MSFYQNVRRFVKRNQSSILSYISITGVVATAVSAVKVTPKAIDRLNVASKEKGEELTPMDLLLVVGPVYIPSIIIGGSTIACILGADILSKKQQASLISAYSLLQKYHQEYQNKVIEFHGQEEDLKIKNSIMRDKGCVHYTQHDHPDGKVVFYDDISGESFERYEREVMDAEYHLNRNFVFRGYACLNEFYEFLGLPLTDYGETVGWSCSDGYSWIDFEHRLITSDDGGDDIYAIDIIFAPDAHYLRDWT